MAWAGPSETVPLPESSTSNEGRRINQSRSLRLSSMSAFFFTAKSSATSRSRRTWTGSTRRSGRGKGLDVLVANAAVGAFVTLEQTTEEHFDQTFAVNVRGTLFTVQKALPLLNDEASIVLVGSTAADRGVEAFGGYAASKAAVRSFARTWSNELKDRGIRVNVVSPAWIETPGAPPLSATRRPLGPSRRMSPRPWPEAAWVSLRRPPQS